MPLDPAAMRAARDAAAERIAALAAGHDPAPLDAAARAILAADARSRGLDLDDPRTVEALRETLVARLAGG